ncbi:MAG: hypothetical protein ACYSW4_00080 [Planctomycetota bacterium]|jgi:prepilin-type processing-associated H-X9-DG protein
MSERDNNAPAKKPITSKLAAILVIVVLTILVLLIVWRALFPRVRELGGPPPGGLCPVNLSGLVKAMVVYANDDELGRVPGPDRWCDVLIGQDYTSCKQFVCRGSDAIGGECSYAINKNVASKSMSVLPGDMVVLFETNFGKDPNGRDGLLKDRQCYESMPYGDPNTRVYKLRWNQVGGPEILTTGNHKGKGCNVAFVDTRVKFVRTSELGQLKWKVEEGEGK